MIVGSLAVVLLGLAWSLASPPGASPDDDFHLATIWCNAGNLDMCRRTGQEVEKDIERVLVIRELAPPCYGLHPDVSAGCLAETGARPGMVPGRADDGLYPGGFHRVMSLFATSDVGSSVIVMRIVSWLLAMALLVAAAALAGPDLRRAFSLAALATLAPLGVYLFASNNPSGLTVAGVAAYWCAAHVYMDAARDDRRRALAAAGVMVVGAVVALGSRYDAGVYLAVAGVTAWISTGGYTSRMRGPSLLILGVTAIGAVVALGTQSRRVAEGGVRMEEPSFTVSLFDNALELPHLVLGSLGTFALGAFDTPMPGIVGTLMLLAFGGLILVGVASASAEKWVALAVVAGAAAAVPLTVLVAGRFLVGDPHYVPPRYVLPLLPIIVATAVLGPRGRRGVRLRRGQVVLVVVAVSLAHAAALHTNIRRYVTGLDEKGPDLGESVEWWWGTGPGPLATWLYGSLAFVVVALCALATTRESAARCPAPEPARGGPPTVGRT